MVVVENTADVHNVIVCTLCSCYPWPVLGLPPNWYKEPAYRARIVKAPRKVLREDFGYDVPDRWRSGSGTPARKCATGCCPRARRDRRLSEAELAELVTRDSMIGVGPAASPGVMSTGLRPDATELGDARGASRRWSPGCPRTGPASTPSTSLGDPCVRDGRGRVQQRAVRVVGVPALADRVDPAVGTGRPGPRTSRGATTSTG